MVKHYIPNLRSVQRSLVILICCAATLQAIQLRAQQVPIKGRVTDASDGSPLIGANVLIKATSTGTITDVNGEFSVDTTPGATLMVSFIGYVSQEVTATVDGPMDIKLEYNSTSLNEVVVVGFGEQRKENLSGAVDVVPAKALEDRPLTNISQGLQGTVPNLNVDFLSGEPGASPKINIRGFTSINGGNPLIIVDGVPMDASELNYIAPSDVQSISVLKDASSAAIYGARAAYGVILITTKTGTKDGISISYSNNFSWSKPTVLPNKITDPYIYSRLLETSTDNTPWDYVNYSDAYYQWAKQRSDNPESSAPVRLNPLDPTLYEYMGDRDWTKQYLDNNTFSQRQSISVSGRSNSTTYYLSGAYDSQNGALKIANDDFSRYTMRGKINFRPTKWLSIGNNTTFAQGQRRKPRFMDIMSLYNLFPTDWDVNPDGTWANNEVGRTGARLTDGGRIGNNINMFQTSFNGELSFFERMLRLNADYSIRTENQDSTSYETKYKIGFGPDDVREEGNNNAYRMSGNETYTVLNVYATFDKKFGNHAFQVVAGYNQEYNKWRAFSAWRDRIISASLPTIELATGESVVRETYRDWALRGLFYRLNYIFKDKYIVEFNGRYDGSSKFPENNRFGFFPSASAAWRVDAEPFWSSLSSTIDMFKLRASYGSLGNQSVSEYGYISTMEARRGSYLIDGSLPQIVTSSQLVSPDYTWEKVSTRNFGVDLGFLGQRITASFDVYNRKTDGMLTQGKELPGVLGADEPKQNAADLETKGWEMAIGLQHDVNVGGKPLRLTSRFILSDSRSQITSFDNPNRNLTQFYNGMQLGEIWGLRSDGLFQSEQEIEALDQSTIVPWGALTVVPGWPKYQDLDNNGAIEKGLTVDDPKDLSVIGNMMPRMRYGINLGAEWQGIDLRLFFQGVGKMDYYPLHYLYWGFYQQPYAGGYDHLMDFYRAASESGPDRDRHSQSYIEAGLADANPDAKFPVLQSWLADRNLGERIDEAQGLAIPQTRYMQSAAYLRLKNITVGYTLPAKFTSRLGINRFRIYASGENLMTWSGIKEFFDPEAVTDNVAKVNPSYSSANGWGYAYPFQRRLSFGLDVQF